MQYIKDKSTIGGRLKILREKNNLTQQKASFELGFGQYTSKLSRMETNDQDITAKELVILCKYYHVSADYLLGLNNPDRSDMLDLSGLTPSQKSAFITLRRDIR